MFEKKKYVAQGKLLYAAKYNGGCIFSVAKEGVSVLIRGGSPSCSLLGSGNVICDGAYTYALKEELTVDRIEN